MMSTAGRLTSKRAVTALILGAASVTLVSGSQEWVSGTVNDAVLGVSALQGKGSEVAPGAMAAALVGLASAVVAATSGAAVRVAAAAAALLSAILGVTVILVVLADPGGALGRLAAAGTGRSGLVAAQGRAGSWGWLALTAMLVMAFGGVGALVGGRRWRRLSSRYDSPVANGSLHREPTGESASAWDQLTRGQDPTVARPTAKRPEPDT